MLLLLLLMLVQVCRLLLRVVLLILLVALLVGQLLPRPHARSHRPECRRSRVHLRAVLAEVRWRHLMAGMEIRLSVGVLCWCIAGVAGRIWRA